MKLGLSSGSRKPREPWGGVLSEAVSGARRWGPGAGARGGAGDGVRSGSLAGIGTHPIQGSPERAELEGKWRYLRQTGRLGVEPGTVEVSHRYSQRRHFAQTGESECLPGGGAKGPRPIMVGIYASRR